MYLSIYFCLTIYLKLSFMSIYLHLFQLSPCLFPIRMKVKMYGQDVPAEPRPGDRACTPPLSLSLLSFVRPPFIKERHGRKEEMSNDEKERET